MVKEFVDNLTEVINAIFSKKPGNVELMVKHFFSGAALFANGKICITLTPVGFAIKLPEDFRVRLLKEKGVKVLRYFPKAPIKKEYVVLPESKLRDVKKLKVLIKKSIEYVTVK